MGSFTEGTQPITVRRGRDLALPMKWESPAGVAINITGFTISGALKWRGKTKVLTVADRVNAAGTWEFQLVASELATIPLGQLSRLTVTIIDTAAETHDFVNPVVGVEI